MYRNLREDLSDGVPIPMEITENVYVDMLSDMCFKEPLLAHLSTPKYQKIEYFFFKRQLICMHRGVFPLPKPMSVESNKFYFMGVPSIFWRYLGKKIQAILYYADNTDDPRYNPEVIYNTAVEIQSLFPHCYPLVC